MVGTTVASDTDRAADVDERHVSGNTAQVALGFDGPPEQRVVTCQSCSREYPLITAFITDDGVACAVVFAACHSHDGRSEAWLDVTLGSFVEPNFDDHVTFSCRVRDEGATLVDGLVAANGRAAFFGNKLGRSDAAHHPSLSALWAVVDYVITAEPAISATVYGPQR